MATSEITVVSALVDLASREAGSRRDIPWYLERCSGVLSTDHALIVFTEPELVAGITGKRRQLAPDAPTRIVGLPFDHFPRARDIAEISRAFEAGQRPPTASNTTKDSPAYLAFGWSKPELLAMVAKENPFQSRAFWWSDIALSEVAQPLHDQSFDGLLSSWNGHLHANVLWETDRSEYAHSTQFYSSTPFSKVAGGLFGVSADHALTFASDFAFEADRCLESGWPTIDEVLLGVVVDRQRSAATLSYGPWETLLANFNEPRLAAWHRFRLLRDCINRGLRDRARNHFLQIEAAINNGRLSLSIDEHRELEELRRLASS
ncbi:unannotated protein [freshwater metagenome]|uniref:Unannotated protein n=1 Tax=freshwater metagenome TaxID=449393 RepID=A0A6J7LXR2_9ZZZZ